VQLKERCRVPTRANKNVNHLSLTATTTEYTSQSLNPAAILHAMSKPVVFVTGATGNVGYATVQVLAAKYAGQVEIRAGVRNPDKADKLKAIAGVSVVKAVMGSAELSNTLKGVHALFIITPSSENRVELALSAAESAHKAGVKYQMIVSVAAADNQDTVFGRNFHRLETTVKELGITYTFFRLPWFLENFLGLKDTIKGAGAIFSPVDPTKSFNLVTLGDIGNAAAAILVSPSKHANKTYEIISDRHSYNDIAAAFGEVLGKTVTYNRVTYDAAKQGSLEQGLAEWQVDGLFETFKLIDSAHPVITNASLEDYTLITGEQPTSLKAWIAQVKGAFE
jgi:uncharacterized protein YbjT (DUF2867 family)